MVPGEFAPCVWLVKGCCGLSFGFLGGQVPVKQMRGGKGPLSLPVIHAFLEILGLSAAMINTAAEMVSELIPPFYGDRSYVG